MKYRIIQLELQKQKVIDSPLCELDLIATDEEVAFLGTVSNYISDGLCIEDEIEDFERHLKHKTSNSLFEINNLESITFKPGFKESWFKRRFDDFKNISKKFKIDDFLSLSEVGRLHSIIEGDNDIYIYTKDNYVDLDTFIRRLPDKEITFYFGSILEFY